MSLVSFTVVLLCFCIGRNFVILKSKSVVSLLIRRTGIEYRLMTDVFALVMQFQIPVLPGIALMALEFLENSTNMKMYSIQDVYGRSDYKILPS